MTKTTITPEQIDEMIDDLIGAVQEAETTDDAVAYAHAVAEAQAVKERIDELARACESALRWVENMKIVPGGERERLRDQLRAALKVERR